MNPEVDTVQSQRKGLARVRVYPVDDTHWLVVGVKKDVTVVAQSFFQLLDEVRKARKVTR